MRSTALTHWPRAFRAARKNTEPEDASSADVSVLSSFPIVIERTYSSVSELPGVPASPQRVRILDNVALVRSAHPVFTTFVRTRPLPSFARLSLVPLRIRADGARKFVIYEGVRPTLLYQKFFAVQAVAESLTPGEFEIRSLVNDICLVLQLGMDPGGVVIHRHAWTVHGIDIVSDGLDFLCDGYLSRMKIVLSVIRRGVCNVELGAVGTGDDLLNL